MGHQTTTSGVSGQRLALHLMIGAGGFSALSWEGVWQLQASLAFGISAAGTALTLAATMGGMTLGSIAAGSWLRTRENTLQPLRLYGALELVVGLSGLLVLPGFRLLEQLDAAVYATLPSAAPFLHGAGMGLLIAPASMAMGATVPVFQLVARAHKTRISGLYASNTAGAALGVLALSFFVLPRVGVALACVLLSSINGIVAALAWVLRAPPRKAGHAATRQDAPALSPRVALWVVGFTGFATFALEVVWFRAMRAAFWSTSGTFAILLAAVLLPLAAGARVVPVLRRRGVGPGSLLACSGAAILLATPLIERFDLAIGVSPVYAVALVTWLGLSLLTIGPAVLCLGTALPWCLEDNPAPRETGRLYAANAFGSVTGALFAAWLLLPALGASRSAWAIGVGVILLAAWVASRGRGLILAAGAASLAVAAAYTSSPGRDRVQFSAGLDGHAILAHDEGPDFTASVVEGPAGERLLFIDGFVATSDHPGGSHYMEWMGRLPAVLHHAPKRGLVICFGTGQTANGLREEGVAELDVVELSSAIFDLAPHFPSNDRVLEDPRVTPITMDGRAWLRRTERQYDVITLEPMPPNFAGVNALYSHEFYEIMAKRLAPGGIVAQWLPIHMLTTRHARSIARTFLASFPDAILWFDPIGGTGILLGRRSGSPVPLGREWPGLPRAERDLAPAEIRRSAWLRQRPLAAYAGLGQMITDDNQLLQWSDLRPQTSDETARKFNERNLRLLEDFAGRPPYTRRRPPRHPNRPPTAPR